MDRFHHDALVQALKEPGSGAPPGGLVRLWLSIRQLSRGLRVAGVASLSVLLGLLMYGYVAQVQDLFLEVRGDRASALMFWASFYLAVLAGWVLPVYVSARWIIARQNELARSTLRDDLVEIEDWVVGFVPALLGGLALLAVTLGQWEAITGSPRSVLRCGDASLCWEKIQKFDQAMGTLGREPLEVLGSVFAGSSERWTIAATVLFPQVLYWIAILTLISLLLGSGHHWLGTLFRRPIRFFVRFGYWIIGIPALLLAGLFAIEWWAGLTAEPSFALAFFLFSRSDKTQAALNFSNEDWADVKVFTLDRLLDQAGPGGVLVLSAIVVGLPLGLFVLTQLYRWLGRIELKFLRRHLRFLTLWAGAGAIGTAFVGFWLASELYGQVAKTLNEELSINDLVVLPFVTLVLVVSVWIGLRLHARRGGDATPDGKHLSLFTIVLAVCGVALLVTLAVDPVLLTHYLSRAPLMPVLLGIWVPVLTWLTGCSFCYRAPLAIGSAAALGAVTWLFGELHDIRQLPEDSIVLLRPGFEETLSRWANVNGCDLPQGSVQVQRPCPQPIIALASGGASRAAFKVASVVGTLMDGSNTQQASASLSGGKPPRHFFQQLFAVSSVSGGSLATVMLQATLADAQQQPRQRGVLAPPCRVGTKDPLWFANSALGGRNPQNEPQLSWKSCLQLLVAGDFLSPVAVSLVGADLLNLNALLYGDRAATLERAWERRYKSLVDRNTLAGSLVSLRQELIGKDRGAWLPVMLLNGTSVATGRRVIASDVDFLTPSKPGGCRLVAQTSTAPVLGDCRRTFNDAYDLHELFGSGRQGLPADQQVAAGAPMAEQTGFLPGPAARACDSCDIRLSTGATISARFPVISPHGAIRNADGEVADRVVDGGYFENNGATTAQELASALRARGLKPLVILITNDPQMPKIPCVSGDVPLDYPASGGAGRIPVLFSPIGALEGTREARGRLASIELCELMRDLGTDGGINFLHFGVSAEADLLGTKQLSMSWWLSKHVQKKLDSIEIGDRERIARVLEALQQGTGPELRTRSLE